MGESTNISNNDIHDWYEELKSSTEKVTGNGVVGGELSILHGAYDKQKVAKLREENDAEIAEMVANVKRTIEESKFAFIMIDEGLQPPD